METNHILQTRKGSSFPYLERASQTTLTSEHDSFENGLGSWKMVKTDSKWVTMVNPNWTTKNKPENKDMSWRLTYMEEERRGTNLLQRRGKP